jgi:hypothetical protein
MKYDYKRGLQIHNSSENSGVNSFSIKKPLYFAHTAYLFIFSIDSQKSRTSNFLKRVNRLLFVTRRQCLRFLQELNF